MSPTATTVSRASASTRRSCSLRIGCPDERPAAPELDDHPGGRAGVSPRQLPRRPRDRAARGRGLARGKIVVDKRHLHPGGFVHGGVWTALGDTVAAWATFRSIPPGHNFTTIELKLNVFAAGILGDEIEAVAEPLHVGKSTVVIEVRIERRREGKEPRLAANLIVSQFVLPPQSG
jgi:uncharacterized protein (TIGR00369 family)